VVRHVFVMYMKQFRQLVDRIQHARSLGIVCVEAERRVSCL